MAKCANCDGSGEVPVIVGIVVTDYYKKCPICNGSGEKPNNEISDQPRGDIPMDTERDTFIRRRTEGPSDPVL